MDSVCVIIRDVIPDQTAQMNVIEDDQVIEKLSATASDPAFRDSIGVIRQKLGRAPSGEC